MDISKIKIVTEHMAVRLSSCQSYIARVNLIYESLLYVTLCLCHSLRLRKCNLIIKANIYFYDYDMSKSTLAFRR